MAHLGSYLGITMRLCRLVGSVIMVFGGVVGRAASPNADNWLRGVLGMAPGLCSEASGPHVGRFAEVAHCQRSTPLFWCSQSEHFPARDEPLPTSYAIAGTCLSTAAAPVQLRQLLRDPAPLVAIAQVNPMAAAALSEAWESSNGVKPISLDRLRVAFDAQYNARQVREGLAGMRVTGSALAPEDWITAESTLVSADGDATLVYRIDTFRQSGDGKRLAVGPAVSITVTWSSFAWVLDTPAQLNFEVLRYQLAAWVPVEASSR